VYRTLRARGSQALRRTILKDGTSESVWVRQVMNRSVRSILDGLPPASSACLEVSGDFWAPLPWKSYSTLSFPEFDLLAPPADFEGWGAADVVICEQVLEHVEDPAIAMSTLQRLVRPGGTVLVSTPFLLRIHRHPIDCWRFTPHGLSLLMQRSGFENVNVWSWGNRRCIRANFRRWAPHRPWRTLKNEPDFPMVVWATGVSNQAPDRQGGSNVRSMIGR
jgi:SAM-dependent methyltransferase